MDSAGVSSSPFHPYKAKKVLRFTVNKQHIHPPRRPLTDHQVSQAAKHLRKLDLKPSVSSEPLKSSAKLITLPNTSNALPQSMVEISRAEVNSLHSFQTKLKKVSDHSFTDVDCVSIAPSESKLPESPVNSFDFRKQDDISSMDGTLPELTLASFTPPAVPRKMFRTITRFNKRSCCRSLNFDSVSENIMPPPSSDYDDDIRDLIASSEDHKRKRLEKKDPTISDANWRKQMTARLPQLVDSILDIFLLRTSMTKEELVYKISTRHMVEPREVNEKLTLMLELAPEWIQEKMYTGHICVDKSFRRELILTRLSQAN